ncbi:DUF2442 domain-containing protein [Phyllobacterium zundukense]|uniref:DUF2442 domain-containing protein n=1 Tax=Phyllobacterium zundukense TaxID=1867719 RepID=A0A2N9VVM2_9HYPH|nr:DUF2442 domain-containing protein [Phyllobacterium zundukense]ATU91274.1 hypothetical protein BLM14_06235 [Phyllobacterium zundukense]PIO43540.1 hypothetical protein B5P45_16620 [Phyllobacterium zundukense]
MAELTDAEIDAAGERGRRERETEPRARNAYYDRESDRIVIDLVNESTFSFPPHLAQNLETATADQLAAVEIIGDGFGLHWEELDTDFTVAGLVSGIFGTQAYLARRAGQATSPAKAIASRANGAKGGRPRKAAGR